MEQKYQITGYQIIYANGQRDNVKLYTPEITDDLEDYRKNVKHENGCVNVCLSYVIFNV